MSTPKLRLWQVEISLHDQPGYRRNKSLYIAAPDIQTAIDEALEVSLLGLEKISYHDAWVVSASHRGPVHRVVEE